MYKKAEWTGLISSAFLGGNLIGLVNTATAIIAFITALLSLLVLIEKHTSIDIPFIQIKEKQDGK